MGKFIPVALPSIGKKEQAYAADCLKTSWISSIGKYIDAFEKKFAAFCGVKHAVACSNGTVSLHAALLAAGIKPGDEVIVPALTFIATANAVVYCGAKPVFADCEPDTWNIAPASIEKLITKKTRAVIAVHLYGHPADMAPILRIARKHKLILIEDAAEAHGAEYRGKRVGSIGDIGVFSFFGNKIITTGEGGMVVTNSASLANKVRMLKGQGMNPKRKYWFPIIGYNYRMTNIEAAIGLAQLERAPSLLRKRRVIAGWYYKHLKKARNLILPVEKKWARNVFWMFTVVLKDGSRAGRDKVMKGMHKAGIETRPVFYPMHVLPPYRKKGISLPVTERVARNGINLPTYTDITEKDVAYICKTLVKLTEIR